MTIVKSKKNLVIPVVDCIANKDLVIKDYHRVLTSRSDHIDAMLHLNVDYLSHSCTRELQVSMRKQRTLFVFKLVFRREKKNKESSEKKQRLVYTFNRDSTMIKKKRIFSFERRQR